MCKYCKKLNDLMLYKDKHNLDVVQAWKRHVKKGEDIITDFFALLEYKGVANGPAYIRLRKKAEDWLNTLWIGK